MLRRVIYDGKIAHGDKVYAGTHPAIIDADTFARVQAKLAENIQGSVAAVAAPGPACSPAGSSMPPASR